MGSAARDVGVVGVPAWNDREQGVGIAVGISAIAGTVTFVHSAVGDSHCGAADGTIEVLDLGNQSPTVAFSSYNGRTTQMFSPFRRGVVVELGRRFITGSRRSVTTITPWMCGGSS